MCLAFKVGWTNPTLGRWQPANRVIGGTPTAALRALPISGLLLWHGVRRCARTRCCGAYAPLRRAPARKRRESCARTESAKRAQRSVLCQSPWPAILPARSAAVGVPTTRPAAGATPRSGLVQPTLQRPCHGSAPPRQAVPLCEEAKPRTKTPTHTTIRHAARRAVNALFGYFLALGQKVTRPGGRNHTVQQPTACHQQRPPKQKQETPIKKTGPVGPVQTLAGPVLRVANCSTLRTVDHRCSDFPGRLC
ncbi:hypothetical protein FHX60_002306 [Cupriavidus alkaliphilus]|nr:hypothetical protein [Cupriavidus alkaliphilus]